MIVKSILDTDLYKFTTSYAYMKLFPHAIGTFEFFDPIQGLWKTEVYELAKWLIGYYYGCGIKKEVDADGARKICEAIKKSMSLTPTDGLGISNSDLDQIGAKSYYDVDRVLQTLTCKASPENDKLQDELTTELGPGKITGRRFKSRFKRLVSPIIVPREMYD